jgi:hypothetical protein
MALRAPPRANLAETGVTIYEFTSRRPRGAAVVAQKTFLIRTRLAECKPAAISVKGGSARWQPKDTYVGFARLSKTVPCHDRFRDPFLEAGERRRTGGLLK